jgi:hypothetical protein
MSDNDQEMLWFLPAVALGIGGGVWFGWQHWWLATVLGVLSIPIAIVLGATIGPFRAAVGIGAYLVGYVFLSDGTDPIPIWLRHLLALPVGLAFLFQQVLWDLAGTILWYVFAVFGLASAHVASVWWLWNAGYELVITGLGAASFLLSALLRRHAEGAPLIAVNLLVAWLFGLIEMIAGVVLRFT